MIQKTLKLLKRWHMGTHLRVLNESYPMNTNMWDLDGFQKSFPCALDESSLSIGEVKRQDSTERSDLIKYYQTDQQ